MKPIHVVIAAAVAYLVYRKRKSALGGDPPLNILPPTSAPGTEPDYTPWTVYAPVAPKPMIDQFVSKLPWPVRAASSVASGIRSAGQAASSAASSAASYLVLPSGVAPDWKAENADLVQRLELERAERRRQAAGRPVATFQDITNIKASAAKIASDVSKAYGAVFEPKKWSSAPVVVADPGQIDVRTGTVYTPSGPPPLVPDPGQIDVLTGGLYVPSAPPTFAPDFKPEPVREITAPPARDLPPVGPTAPEKSSGINWDAIIKKGVEFGKVTLGPGMAAKTTVEMLDKKVGDALDKDAKNRIGAAVAMDFADAIKSGDIKADEISEDNPRLKERMGVVGGIATLQEFKQKADRNGLTVDDLVKMDKTAREAARDEGVPKRPKLSGDTETLENMRLVNVLKPKLDEETAKVQEDGFAPTTVNGKTKWKKIDANDPAALEKWRRDRAEELATAYRAKTRPKIEAEQKATDEFIGKHSAVMAKAKDLISNNILDSAPRMTPTGSDAVAKKKFQEKYGYKGELTTDSYMRLIKDYAKQMEENLSSGSGGPSTEGALPFILWDQKRNIDVLLPVFSQAADPTLDQDERFDRLKNFAGALDALTVDLARKSVPKFLSQQGDAAITVMLNQGASANMGKSLGKLQEKRNAQLADARARQSQQQYAALESALTAPLKRGEGEATDRSKGLLGIDDIAAMEFGRNRRSRT